jgi:hypothetical protein
MSRQTLITIDMNKRLLLFFATVFFSFMTHAQVVQRTIGTTNHEEILAVIELPNQLPDKFVAIGNVTVNAQSRVWITSYNTPAAVLTSATIFNSGSMVARDISPAPMHPVLGKTFYITGWTNVGGLDQMFAARVDLRGNIIWLNMNVNPPAPIRMEGVAIVTEPGTDDAVALGIAQLPGGTPQVALARFNAAGVLIWSNIYTASGEWMPREIDLGPGNIGPMGDFIITGEKRHSPGPPQTFAARYNGAGLELWRNLYPAVTVFPTMGDAGYDVVYEPVTGNFCIAGAVQTTALRGGPGSNSTPYILSVNQGGALVTSSVYMNALSRPLGMYPRSVSLGRNPGEIIMAGPQYDSGHTFLGILPTIAPPGPATFKYFNGYSTANSTGRLFVLDDAVSEDVLYPAPVAGTSTYFISTNAMPGKFGMGDGHFIQTDSGGNTDPKCVAVSIPNIVRESFISSPTISEPSVLLWSAAEAYKDTLPVQDTTCQRINPVTLIQFNAVRQTNNVLVHWQTSQEVQLSHYEVERSTDGSRFVSLARINARGGAGNIEYRYTDNQPGFGLVHYHLKMVDRNGTVSYSHIAKIDFDNKYGFNILPNPARDYITIAGNKDFTRLEIVDVNGRVVRSLQKNLSGRYPVSGLQPGVYMIRTIGAANNVAQKIIIE